MNFRVIAISFLMLCFGNVLSGQYYQTGQDPASIRWMQVKTGRFNIIFPENNTKEGLKYAKSLEESYNKLSALFPGKKFTLPVVLHSYTIQSNGYVAWAPRRMELYPTPEQNTIPLAADKQLAVHELTHVMQMESLNQGFTRVLSFLFGEQLIGAESSLLPMWFLEGDAVYAESALTESGRGRTPAFQKEVKALLLSGKKTYSYDKILNGSFRDFVPDDYETGFQMVTWAIAKNGPGLWNKVLNFTAGKPFSINPVNFSLNAEAGLKKKTLWKMTSDSLKSIWNKEQSRIQPSKYEELNADKHGKYINYYSPVPAGTDSIIAIKTSLTEPPSFVLINPGERKEKRLSVPGQIYPWFFSFARGKLVWVESVSDPRWTNREYSVIKVMNINNRVITRLSSRSRYLAAAVSPDGKQIAASENTVVNNNNLVLINSETGSIIRSLPTPGNIYLQHPQWSPDGKVITFVFLSEEGEGIIKYEPITEKWEILVEASRNDLQSSFLRNDSLFYVSSASGTDNIIVKTPGNKKFLITRSAFGVTDIASDGHRLLFCYYSSLGNYLSVIQVPLKEEADQDINSTTFLINRAKPGISRSDEIGTGNYNPVPYHRFEHLFRFHSWMPFYTDIQKLQSDPAAIRPGITVMSQNTLSTFISTIGYEYSADKRNVLHTAVTWNGIYPVIETQVDYGTKPVISTLGQDVASPTIINNGVSLTNTISIPLSFNSSRFSRFFQPSLSVEYANHYVYIKENNAYDYGQTIITGRLFFSNYDRQAIRDIYPRWAQVLDFNYCFAPFNKQVYGSAISFKTDFYFPGIIQNNSLRLRFETENQNPSKFLYSSFSDLPRGYYNIIVKEIQLFSADYALPLVYPDINIASLFYLKRIRGGFFYDYASSPGNALYIYGSGGLTPMYKTSDRRSLSSYGVQLLADFHLLRIPFMISGGFQAAWKNSNTPPDIEALFNIDLYGMTIGKRRSPRL